MMSHRAAQTCRGSLALALAFAARIVLADGVVVDRMYEPYVQPLETELEFRSVTQHNTETPDVQKQLLGLGRSLTDRIAVEVYAIGTHGKDEDLSIDSTEIEVKWQLTEQGEYAVDWGLLFELEREFEDNAWEASTSILTTRDLGRWTGTANLDFIYEWGSGIDNEFETTLHLQMRYRYREAFEPGFEFHAGQDTIAAGPVLTGLYRIATGHKLRWSLGAFTGLDNVSPDNIVRANLEYEF
jgi:hypothetical protein